MNGFSRGLVVQNPRSVRWRAAVLSPATLVAGGAVSRTSYDSNHRLQTILQQKSMTTTRTTTTARLLSPEQSQDRGGGDAANDDGLESSSPTTMVTPTPTDLSSSQERPPPQQQQQQQDQTEVQKQSPTTARKDHTLTVCMVPPPDAEHVWDVVSQMRKELKDPGYYRWPPHANLLYPFLVWKDKKTKKKEKKKDCIDAVDETAQDDDNEEEEDDDGDGDDELSSILHKLKEATSKVEPFHVHLNSLGTFGGKQRGVLWLYPYSQSRQHELQKEEERNRSDGIGVDKDDNAVKMEEEDAIQTANEGDEEEPLKRLQRYLEEAFPMCRDQRKGGKFQPHMTLSHFENLTDAELSKDKIYDMFPNILTTTASNDRRSLRFTLDRIYLLQRKGDMGQFLRVAEIGLGSCDGNNNVVRRFDPAQPFPAMPKEEESWVYEERMKLKARRNNNSGRGGGWKGRRGRRGGRQRSRSPRVPDTPEVIAQKRAERKAKKERLEEEERLALLSQQQQEKRDGISHDGTEGDS